MDETRNNKHMVKSTSTYIDQLLENHSKIQVIRLDLSYKKEHARKASLENINQDFTHLLNNRRTNRLLKYRPANADGGMERSRFS